MTMDNIIHLIGAEPSKEMLEVARKKFVRRQKDESIIFTTTVKVSLENFASERLLI
jgi:ubiquinone/menaquinone biosynthesis C-methylase UbiE